MYRAPHSVGCCGAVLKKPSDIRTSDSCGTTFPGSGHVIGVRCSSETSVTRRTAYESKPLILGLVACLAMLLAPAPCASAAPVTTLNVPLVQSFPRAMVTSVARAVEAHAAITAELVDNNTGDFNGNFAADARSTNTLDWSCIRNAESHDNYHQTSGAYGIETVTWHELGMTGVPGEASVRVQDHFALRLFAANGHRFAGSWNDVCTMDEGLS